MPKPLAKTTHQQKKTRSIRQQ